tara:strand:+ start:347 stop:673 length:327 start_codon:yes stop_codon:yes gene_type:complete
MGDNRNSVDLVEFRLNQFETTLSNNFARISNKLDEISAQINASEIKHENTRTRLESLEAEMSKVQLNKEKLLNEINSMKVSLAEKLSWTAGGGVAGTIIIKAFESMSQ